MSEVFEPTATPALFSPLQLRGVTFPNRIGVSPMCMYSSTDGYVDDYHLVHLGRFALGGAGMIVVEATAVHPQGRISHRDLGIWSDEHVSGLARVASFMNKHGAVPGIQLAHAGRKASATEPWTGGRPLPHSPGDPGRDAWSTIAPSPIPAGNGWPVPSEMTRIDIAESIAAWRDAAARAVRAGFKVIELHGAHGYLLHSFFSPLSNHRTDAYGGSLVTRMRYPLEVIAAVRQAIPDDVVLSYRVSVVDGLEGGLRTSDTLAFAKEAHEAGVDIIDTSSGALSTNRVVDSRIPRGFAFHADYSREIKAATDLTVATVGMVLDPIQAELLIAQGDADFVLLGREMLFNPQWPHHARDALGAGIGFQDWHVQAASFLDARSRLLVNLEEAGETPTTRFSGPGSRIE